MGREAAGVRRRDLGASLDRGPTGLHDGRAWWEGRAQGGGSWGIQNEPNRVTAARLGLLERERVLLGEGGATDRAA